MAGLHKRDVDIATQIGEALSVVRLDGDAGVREILPAIRELLRLETTVASAARAHV